MPSLRNTLSRFDGEIDKNNCVSSSPATYTDRPDHNPVDCLEPTPPFTEVALGEKARARDLLAAVRTLQDVEREHRLPTPEERHTLERFPGFGPLALRIFPDPVRGTYKDPVWQTFGEELRSLLTPGEYDSAKRSTFNAFYTSPVVIRAMFEALSRLGIAPNSTVLEPGCGTGRFMGLAPEGMRFIGVELDSLSGRIARTLYPQADIRIEDFRETRLPAGGVDAVVGNVPFANLKLGYRGQRLSLHDYFFARSVDALKPGGVLALVTTHFTLDKQNAVIRERLAAQADFVGAIRLPSDAFKREGTTVVSDVVFLLKRAPGDPARHADPAWLRTRPVLIEGAVVPINDYFLDHPEMMLGTLSRKDRLYDATYSLIGRGDLEQRLHTTIRILPEGVATLARALKPAVENATNTGPPTPPPDSRHVTEGSFFAGDDRAIYQIANGKAEPVTYCGVLLRADGTPGGRKFGSLIQLRDLARRVLQSQ